MGICQLVEPSSKMLPMNDVDKAGKDVVGVEDRETAVDKMVMKEEADLAKRKRRKELDQGRL